MRRLVTLLTLIMLALAAATVLIVITSIQVGIWWQIQSLPADVRESIRSLFADPQNARQVFDNTLFVGVVLAGIVAVVFARFFAKRLASSIEEVSRASVRLARGDLDARVPVHAKHKSLEVVTLTHNFNKMADALQTYEHERRDMIASIAHDLRTPLSAMQIRLELIKEQLIPYSEAETDLLLGQTLLLGRLVNDLRTLSLADAGKLSLQLQRLELGGCVADILKSYTYRTDETGVRLQFSRPEEAVWVDADVQRLAQILSNLLDNAVRATPAGGEIRVRLRPDGGGVTLGVDDDGPGISETLLPRLFDRFVQGKDQTGSSGLGLAIVKTLVELHRGTVSAANRAEGGAHFAVTLPAKPPPAVPASVPTPPAVPADVDSRRS